MNANNLIQLHVDDVDRVKYFQGVLCRPFNIRARLLLVVCIGIKLTRNNQVSVIISIKIEKYYCSLHLMKLIEL